LLTHSRQIRRGADGLSLLQLISGRGCSQNNKISVPAQSVVQTKRRFYAALRIFKTGFVNSGLKESENEQKGT
jgi:hypothetical protein